MPLHFACTHADLPVVCALLAKKAEVNAKTE